MATDPVEKGNKMQHQVFIRDLSVCSYTIKMTNLTGISIDHFLAVFFLKSQSLGMFEGKSAIVQFLDIDAL